MLLGLKSGARGLEGFTLVEILVSMAIFSFLILAVTQMSFTTINTGQYADYFNQGVTLADDKMERLKKFAENEPYVMSQMGYDWFISKGTNYKGRGYPGYLSGLTTATMEVMYDDGSHGGDITSGNGVFTGTDYVSLETMQITTYQWPTSTNEWPKGGRYITRVWTVEPVPNTGTTAFDAYDSNGAVDNNNGLCPLDNVKATVTASWKDMSKKTHSVTLQAYIPRRQTL